MRAVHWLGISILALALVLGCQPSASERRSEAQPAPGARGEAPSGTATGSAAQSPEAAWEQVVAAAKREGRLLLATNPGHRTFLEHALPAFQREYGIETEVLYGNGRETAERVLAEYGAGQVRIDVAVGGDSNFFRMPQDGVLEPFTVPNVAHIAESIRAVAGTDNTYYYPQMLNVYAVLVNTSLIPPERVPRRWADLADPYFKGKIILHNPGTSGGGNTWMSVAHETPGLGRPFLEKIAQQDLLIGQDPAQIESVVARGERGIGLPAGGRSVITQAGAPLQWVVPEEGVAFSVQNLAIPKGAPHPNAARVWINFALSKQVQEWWYQYGNYTPVRVDVEIDRPEFHLANLPLLGGKGNRPPEETQHWLSVGRQLFGH